MYMLNVKNRTKLAILNIFSAIIDLVQELVICNMLTNLERIHEKLQVIWPKSEC